MNRSQHTILIVSGSPDRLETQKFSVLQAGYRVLTAPSGNSAFDIIKESPPDLVVSDALMPDGDGINLCRAMRADVRFRALPVLLLSALCQDADGIAEGLNVGANDCLETPFDTAHLVDRIARLTEPQRTADAPPENEQRFRSVIENFSDMVSIVSGEGIVLYQSPSIKKTLGYEPDGLLGENVFDFVHPDDKPELVTRFNRATREKCELPPVEYRFRHNGGSWRVLESVGSFIDDSERGSAAVISSRDITKRRRAENTLRQSEANLAAAQRITHLGSWEVELRDLQRVNNNKVQWSDEVYRIFGYAPGGVEVSIKRYFASIHPADRSRSRRAFSDAVTRRQAVDIEFRVVLPNGSERMLHGRAEVLFDESANKPLKFIGTVQDITERKRTENELRESEERYRAFVGQSSEAIWRLELEPPCPVDISEDEQIDWLYRFGFIAECNEKMARMYGFARADEIVGVRIGDIMPRSEPANIKQLRALIRSQYKLVDSDSSELDKDGNTLIFSNNITGIVEDRRIRRVWGTQRDITEQRAAEKAIRFQAHLLDTVEQSVIATNLDGIVIYWNQFAEKLYGWSSPEALNQNIMDLTTPDTSLEQAHEIMANLRVGKGWTGELKVSCRDGRMFSAEITNSPIYDENGTLIGISGISKDITDQKQTESALIEANDRAVRQYNSLLQRLAKLGQATGAARDLKAVFSAVLDFTCASAPCSALLISLYDEQPQTRKIIYCWYNGNEMDASGFVAVPVGDGLVGQAIKTGEVVINNDYFNSIQKRNVSVSFGFDKDNREPQSSIIAPMKIKGVCVGVIEVQSYDLGAYREEHATAMSMAANFIANAIENVRLLELERQREEQFRQSQKLESVGRLAGGIAHDFNNMLTAINGYSSLTLRRLGADDPLRHNIEEIKKAGERSASLTHQLLAFSRQQVLKPKILDINQTVNDIGFMLKRLIGEDVQLISALSSELGHVEVDPGQLSQVIMNLAVNARDAMPGGGTLTIETSNVYLDEEFAAHHVPTTAGHYVMLTVSDTGTGIDPETREHIFEPFFTTKEVGKGTGLGLATVYGIVKQSGGYIWVDSEIERGTIFNIYLPRVDMPTATAVQPAASEDLAAGSETILLVEDEPMVRNLSRQILEDCGYTVLEAENGVEAIEICRRRAEEIDLLMTDVVMPQMGGRELAEKLNAAHPRVKVLFTSGYTDDSVVRHGVIEVGTNFIQKPFSPTSLALKVRNILDAR